jgi:GNAT superfamily N-acetyltransferase
MAGITIRTATEADLEALFALYNEFHLFHVLGVPDRLRLPDESEDQARLEAEMRTNLKTLINKVDGVLLVGELLDKRIIGFAEVYLEEGKANSYSISQKHGVLQSLMVSAIFRQQGLGRQLMHAAEKWVKEKGANEIELNAWEFTGGPISFYEENGYRTLKRTLVKRL